ncbi:MAG: energy transducer TonB [Bacteroidota bacterium]|nr:energy transducer TonB [Bacteroidota bacterium]
MDANNILTANILDILFDGKNKEYGAYDLRKSYNKRVSISLIITIGIIAILLIGSVIAGNYSPKDLQHIEGPDVVIKAFKPVELPPPPPPPPILPPPPPAAASVAYLPPVISKDKDVVNPPPEIREILNATIDVKTVEGNKNPDYIRPPENLTGSQVLATPVAKKKEDVEFFPIEINASFPGGVGEWTKYIKKEIQRNSDEFTEADFGTCVVKFIVDKAGKVSQVEAVTMKGTKLADIAVNAIRKGPDWIPARQNGAYVNAYRLQPVVLKNPD